MAASERQPTAAELALSGVLQAASASLPAESSVFLPWAVERCTLADGYIPATAQEVLLLPQLVAAADQHRGSHQSPPSAVIEPIALEVGGRWSAEAVDFVRKPARARARSVPERLRSVLTAAYVS